MGNCCGGGFDKKKVKKEAQQEALWLDAPHLKLGPGQSLREGFIVSQEAVGRGRTSIIWSGTDRVSGVPVAIKRCSKKNLALRRVTEIEILLKLQSGDGCPRLPRLLATYEDPKRLYLVTQLCSGGDLYARIAQSQGFSEADASAIVGQLVEALAHLHRHHVVHRDLKPENVLFEEEGSRSVQLVDLGSAVLLPPGTTMLNESVGGGFFVAPEVHGQQSYTQACDMWSLGALLFVIMGGVPPPTSRDVHATPVWLKLSVGQFDWLPDNTSPTLDDLLKRLLTPNMSARITAEEAMKHPWITQQGLLCHDPLLEVIKSVKAHVGERTRLLQESRCFYVQENNRAVAIKRTSDVPEQMEAWRKSKPMKVSKRDLPLVEVNRHLMAADKKTGAKIFVEVLPRKSNSSKRRLWQQSAAYEECKPKEDPEDHKRTKSEKKSKKTKGGGLSALKEKRQ